MGKQAAGLAFGVIGGFVGGLFTAGAFSGIGFGIGMSIGGGLLNKQPGRAKSKAPSPDGVGLPFFGAEYYGTVGDVRPQLIACGRNKKGLPVAFRTQTETEGGGCGEPETETTEFSLQMALFIASTINTGPVIVDAMELEDGEGTKVVFDRFGSTAKARGIELTPQFKNGILVAELSDKLRLYPGTALQMPDTALQEWLGAENVTAYRHRAYMVINGLRVKSQGAAIKLKVRSLLTNRRSIVRAKLKSCGYPGHRLFFAHIDGEIDGIRVTEPQAPREFCERVARWANCGLAFDGSRLVDTSLVNPTIHEITEKVLGARNGSEKDGALPALETIQQKGVDQLPSAIRVPFSDINLNYDDNQGDAQRREATHTNRITVEGGEVSNTTRATRLARAELDQAWTRDRTWNASLMPGLCELLAGDVLRVTTRPPGSAAARTRDYIVLEHEREPSGIITPTAEPWKARDYYQPGVVDPGQRPAPVVEEGGAPRGFVCETVPIFDSMMSGIGVMAAACPDDGANWKGAYFEDTKNTDYKKGIGDKVKLTQPAQIGELVEDFELGETDRFDYSRTLTLRMFYGAPQNATEAATRAGANTLLLATGRLVSFVSVSQIGEDTYQLIGIKDGRAGTDCGDNTGDGFDIAQTALAGTRVLLLTDASGQRTKAAKWVKLDSDLNPFKSSGSVTGSGAVRGELLSFDFWTPGDRDTTSTTAKIVTGENLKTLAPVAVRLVRTPEGGAILTGRFRSRYPDAEEAWDTESNGRQSDTRDVEIWLSDGTYTQRLSRTASGSAGFRFDFSAGDLGGLFGSMPAILSGQIAQVSTRAGAGRRRAFAQSTA